MKKKPNHREIDGLSGSADEIKETKKQYKKRMKPSTDANNIQLIQENMYNLYKLTPQELDPLLGQTYHRKEGGESVGGGWSHEEYCCVIKITEEDSWRLYNELSLHLSLFQCVEPSRRLSLCVDSVDDKSWTAYIPYTGQDLFLLWCSVIEKIRPTVTLDYIPRNDWYAFTHGYFLQITKELGATEYDYG